MKQFIPAIALLLFFSSVSSAAQDEAVRTSALHPGGDHPGVAAALVAAEQVRQDPAWAIGTGARKGVLGQTLDEEVFAGPDAAVLKSGFFENMGNLLAEFREPSILVEPWEIAGRSKTKPLLIISSGGLYGLRESVFFKAGLAEYARSGGIIICFAQQNGADFTALPVPAGPPIGAAGWAEDSGPLFRASTVQALHPILSGMRTPTPALETDGRLISYPKTSTILFSRQDGFPTLIVYPYGSGWVVVTTLFSDFSSGQGWLDPEEKTLIKDLLSWAKTSGKTEISGSGFSLRRMIAVPPLIPRAKQPLGAVAGGLTVLPALQQAGSRTTVSLSITPGPGAAAGQTLFVRVGGQEKFFKLKQEKNTLSFDVPLRDRKGPVPYFVYHSSGRVLHRGGIPVTDAGSKGVVLDMASYAPGRIAKALVSGLGSGELTLTGLGQIDSDIVKDGGAMEFLVPPGLPSGTYALQWKFHGMDDSLRQGELPITVAGYAVKFQAVQLLKDFTGRTCKINATFRVHSTQSLSAKLKLWFRDPGGALIPLTEAPLELAEGVGETTIPLSFKPEQAGIGELIYGLYQTLPEGAGVPVGPITLAAGRTAFDVGDAALLALSTAKPVYYEPAGPVEVSALVFGRGRAKIEVFIDEKQVLKEKAELSGVHTFTARSTDPGRGAHTLRAVVTPERFESVQERAFTYGAQLPDLAVSLPPLAPGNAFMPVAITVHNRGKEPSIASRVALYEGAPSRGGRLIGKAEVPLLGPGKENITVIDWPLYKKSGMRTLYAVVDPDNIVVESNKRNNTAAAEITIPDIALTVTPRKSSFTSDESIPVALAAVNLTTQSIKGLVMSLTIVDPAGRVAASETMKVPELPSGAGEKFEHAFTLAAPQNGVYTAEARISGETARASAAAGLTILPTLALRGTLQGTPAAALLCNPFTVRYGIKNTGNLPLSSGAAIIEIRKTGAERPVISKQLGMNEWSNAAMVDMRDLAAGPYTIALTAKAANRQYGITREFSLAEQPLRVSPPVDVKKSEASLSKALIWIGSDGPSVHQAIAEKIVTQAFDQQDVYYKIVRTLQDFTAQAKSGEFNTLILYEPEEMLDDPDLLRGKLAQGCGIVIAGEGDRARAAAETLGFSFGEPLAADGRMISVAQGSGLSLSGTISISGRILPPRKKGARTAAVIVGGKQPAALLDHAGKGKVLVMPFSLTRSAIDAGSAPFYSLLLRTATLSVVPEHDEPGNVSAAELMVSAPAGPAKTKIVTTLPKGSKSLWTNREGAVKGDVVTHELTADRGPQRLIILYLQAGKDRGKLVTEVFYECNGKYAGQGKVE